MDGVPLGRAIAMLAEADPDRPMLTGWEPDGSVLTLTRAEVERRTNRVARAWADLGVRKGDHVTIALPNSVGFFEAMIASWKLGAVPQPLSSRLPDRERQEIVELADSRIVVGPIPLPIPTGACCRSAGRPTRRSTTPRFPTS